jgi:hypothetical protein
VGQGETVAATGNNEEIPHEPEDSKKVKEAARATQKHNAKVTKIGRVNVAKVGRANVDAWKKEVVSDIVTKGKRKIADTHVEKY